MGIGEARTSRVRIGAAATAGAILVSLTVQAQAVAAGAPASLDKITVGAAAEAYITNRVDRVVDPDTMITAVEAVSDAGSVALDAAFAARSAEVNASIAERMRSLADLGVAYDRRSVDVVVTDIRQNGGTTTARIEESTELGFASPEPGAPASTAYQASREFTFVERSGAWILTDMILLTDGVPPLIDGAEAVAEPVPAVKGASSVPAGTVAEVSLARPPSPDPQGGLPKVAGEGGTSTVQYNYQAMIDYARYWALSYNGSYRKWEGNDCTNFISQALRAGGWGYVSGWYLSNDVWWYNSINQSRTWINATSWWHFTNNSGRAGRLGNVWDSLASDVIQADWNQDWYVDHTMMVTGRGGYGSLYMSYHTNNTRDRPLIEILDSDRSSYWWAWRT